MAENAYLDGAGVAQVWQATKDYVASHAAQPEVTSGTEDEATWLTRETAAGFPCGGRATVRSIKGHSEVVDGSLVSAKPTGIESVGFNLWDEQWELGTISANDGTNVANNTTIRSKNHIPVFAGQTYYFKGKAYFWAYAADKSYVGRISHSGMGGTGTTDNNTITIPNNVSYLRFVLPTEYGTTYKHDLCINLSSPRNGEYEPHWSQSISIPLDTLKPEGLRSAGSVYDELTADALVTRVGSRAYQSGDESDATVTTDGTTTHYPLATPTTTPIDPPLNLTYRTEAGGTETVTHTEATSAPMLDVVYEIDGTAAAASIAPLEGRIASTNYSLGSLLMLGGTLVKVTTAIATGEAIILGQNVTTTTVAAELAALA